ncbi:MAG: hydroxymethylbilane synthase [Deltaproteobacteria bacterium]|nr:MAG: hydroxymethylbilane synthase [Deltaproteobacteria bacterium]
MEIKIGTRKSRLAMWQAEYIKNILEQKNIKAKLFPIMTKGDKILDKSIAKIGSKGVFTEELEEKLRSGEIDIAVHSAKDLQSSLDEDFEIIAFTAREEQGDVLVSRKNLNPENKNISFTAGTSSVRRKALLKHFFPHIKIVDMRGNLQTRISKMDNGDCDALVLAKAGVLRMGYENMIVHEFDQENFIPPVGQGSIAVEIFSKLDLTKKEVLKKHLNHEYTEKIITAERMFLKILEGGCSIPAFCNGKIIDDKIILKGGLISTDGKKMILNQCESTIEHPETAGKILAEYIISHGGRQILDSLKKNSE